MVLRALTGLVCGGIIVVNQVNNCINPNAFPTPQERFEKAIGWHENVEDMGEWCENFETVIDERLKIKENQQQIEEANEVNVTIETSDSPPEKNEYEEAEKEYQEKCRQYQEEYEKECDKLTEDFKKDCENAEDAEFEKLKEDYQQNYDKATEEYNAKCEEAQKEYDAKVEEIGKNQIEAAKDCDYDDGMGM